MIIRTVGDEEVEGDDGDDRHTRMLQAFTEMRSAAFGSKNWAPQSSISDPASASDLSLSIQMNYYDSDETQGGETNDESQGVDMNETNFHEEQHLEVNISPIYTQGREQGKWMVKVMSLDGTITNERLTAQDIWRMENRKVVLEFGPHNQPEGGSGGVFGTWLGMLSTDLTKFPINYVDWRKIPTWRKDDAWEYIQSKFSFDASNETFKKFVMKSLSQKCKGLKTRLWKRFRRNTPEESIEARPDFIPKEQWQDFVHLKFGERAKKLREQNIISRSHYKTPHTLGKKSIARKSKEIFLKTGKRPSRGEIFVCTRQKANGSFVSEEARELSEKLTEKISQNEGNTSGTTNFNDEFFQVFGVERPGRVRCVGLGPTPSTFFQNRANIASNESEVTGLRNRVHELEDKLLKMKDLEDKIDKMNDVIYRLASTTDCTL